jgi:hypothetical protein
VTLLTILFNLYSELMITQALFAVNGSCFIGINITNFLYADGAVLVSYFKKLLVVILNRWNETCSNCGELGGDKYQKIKLMV